MEQVKIPSGKNKLAAVIHRPSKPSGRLAILCPGFLDSKDYDHLVLLAEELVKLGYTAVRFDPTGTWDSEGAISEYTTTQYLRDIKTVKDYMLSEAGYNFILLGGHSMGGRMSMLYAPTDPGISIVLAIMSGYQKAPVRNEQEWQATGKQISYRDLPGKSDEKRQYDLPYSFLPDAKQYNALDRIKELRIPILLIAGEKDALCPPSTMQIIFDQANEPKKFIVVPGIGHDYRHNELEIRKTNELILEELRNYLRK